MARSASGPIKVSESGDANAVIAEGLNVGDRIVVAGQSRLFDGALVDDKPLVPSECADDGCERYRLSSQDRIG